jgi:hypothetical protein
MVRRTAGLEPNNGPRKGGEELQQLVAPHGFVDDDVPISVDAMNLKDVLGQIEPNGRDRREIGDRLSHGRRSFRWVASTTTILARLAFEPDAGAGVVHTINLSER